jgi:hypothetical protein
MESGLGTETKHKRYRGAKWIVIKTGGIAIRAKRRFIKPSSRSAKSKRIVIKLINENSYKGQADSD